MPAPSKEVGLGVMNLHDAFLNASLALDRMQKCSVEKDPNVFHVSDRGRFERLWVALLSVLVESWQSARMRHVREYVASTTFTQELVDILRRARRDGTIDKMIEVRHYMFHRDKREYWDDGRGAVCVKLRANLKIHNAFSKVLLAAVRSLE